MNNDEIKKTFRKIVNTEVPADVNELAENIKEQFVQRVDKGRLKILWEYIMERKITRYAAAAAVLIIVTLVGASIFNSQADKVKPNYSAKPVIKTIADSQPVDTLKAELADVECMFAAGNIDGLVGVLSSGQYESKMAAANFLAKLGDGRAVEALEKLSKQWQGNKQENPFAAAVEAIKSRATVSEPKAIETLAPQSQKVNTSSEPVSEAPVEVVKSKSVKKTDEKILLKINLQVGQKFSTSTTVNQKISQTIQSKPMNIENNMKMTTLDEVLAVDANGTASIKSSFNTIKAEMITEAGKFEFDSENPVLDEPNDPRIKSMSMVFAALSESKFVIDVTPQGRIVKIHGFEDMFENMMKKIGDVEPEQAEAMKSVMKQFMSEERLKNMSNDSFIAFLDEPVGPGDVWYDITSVDMGFPIDMDVTHMLTSRKNGIVYIETVSKMDMGDSESKLIEMNGIKMNMQLSGTMTGRAEVDEVTGMMLKNNMTQKFSGMMKIEPNEHMPDGMAIPITIEQTVATESQEVK